MVSNEDRLLDQVKAQTFLNKNAAFLGCLLCGLKFSWDPNIETACVNSEREFKWNKVWFLSLTQEERKGVLMHELWHIALLHGPRMKERDQNRWNQACDIRINNNLLKSGYSLPKGALYDLDLMDPKITEEKIYESLPEEPKEQSWGTRLERGTPSSNMSQVAMVHQAITTAKMSGSGAGNVEDLLSEFLKPKLPWRTLLRKYLLEKLEASWTWSQPNRRYSNVYLPSFRSEEEGLTSILVALDTSGSISSEEIQRFISEVKFIQEQMNPKKLIVIQFDTQIEEKIEYNPSNPFESLKLKGGGGTDYSDLRDFIVKHSPKLTLIFTDLYARKQMEKVKHDVIWVVSSERTAPFGKTIHVSD